MAYSDTDLATIRAAIASGIRSVTFADGRRTEYQTLDHMLAAEKVIISTLEMQRNAAANVVRRRVPYYRSGL